MEWECFCDASYYDLWCVRPVGECTFGEGFHLVNQAEAEHLRDFLTRQTATIHQLGENAAKAAGEYAEEVGRLREALRYVAEHRPIFDYVTGDRWDQPGSPYDRGRQVEARFLADHARAALTEPTDG